jgi:hypothetical protein
MNQPDAKVSDTLRKELANKLRFGGIEKDKLDELVDMVAQLHQQGLSHLAVHTKGIFPPYTLEVHGVVSGADATTVLNSILRNTNYTQASWFPYGIIGPPESYQLRLQFGGPQGGTF